MARRLLFLTSSKNKDWKQWFKSTGTKQWL